MPVTQLPAVTSPVVQWNVAAAANAVVAVNSDDPVASFASSRISTFMLSAGLTTRLTVTPLPNAARGGEIISYVLESTARRAGGNTGGQYQAFIFDGVNTILSAIHQPGAPPFPGYIRFFDAFATAPDGTTWTQPKADATDFGVLSGPAHGTGMVVFFLNPTVTWTGAASAQELDAISWLLPMLLPALYGAANLVYENVGMLDRLFASALRRIGRNTRPALRMREERELILARLGRRPVFVI